ncbi:DUF7666 domain-containing protein [Ihubacter sp. rT4E-8]|uniref:DUF7666 domain-containing protein n=1 Tax=Ihubacter sp. rT4E-8 TaxID=3242369 RepID=UPI003CE83738
MLVYKGFDKNLKCRGHQYEIGKTYEEDTAEICSKGYHGCERPLDVFAHYPPGAQSRYCIAELDANEQRSDDSKRVGKKIKIIAEIGIVGLVKAQIEYVKEHTTHQETAGYCGAATAGYRGAATAGTYGAATAGYRGAATAGNCGAATAGDRGAATAGYRGAATAGYCGAATAGYRGAATAGYCGAATAGYCGAATAGYCGAATAGNYGAATAGDRGAATAGYRGAATAGYCGAATAGYCGAATSRGKSSVGNKGVAVARGNNVRVKGGLGAVLIIAEEYNDSCDLKDCKYAVVDGEKIKADTWYELKDGEFAESEESDNEAV